MVSWAYVYWFVPCSVNLGHPDLSRWWLRWREPFASRLPEPLLSQDFLSCRWVIYVMGFIYSASSGRRHRTPFLFITVYLARKIWRLPRSPCADLSLIHRAKSVDRRLISSEKPSGRVLFFCSVLSVGGFMWKMWASVRACAGTSDQARSVQYAFSGGKIIPQTIPFVF